MQSLFTIADNLEPRLRRINMWHRTKTKKLTLFDQNILRFKSDGKEISTIEWQELKNRLPSFFVHK